MQAIIPNFTVTADALALKPPTRAVASVETVATERVESLERFLRFPVTDDITRFCYFADLHGHYAALLRMKDVLQTLKSEQQIDLIASIGDNVEGADDIELYHTIFRELGDMVDFSALGDHEFDIHDRNDLRKAKCQLESADDPDTRKIQRKLAYLERATTHSALAEAIEESKLSIAAANFNFRKDSRFEYLQELKKIVPAEVKMIRDRAYLILSVGSPHYQDFLSYHKQSGFNDDVEVMPAHPLEIVLHLREQFRRANPDLPFTTVLASHCGLTFDIEELAHPDIDIILGAHTHNEIYKRVRHANDSITHILHSGQNGYHLGFLEFETRSDGSVSNVQHILLTVEAAASTNVLIQQQEDDLIMKGEKLTDLQHSYSLVGKSKISTPLTRLVSDAIRESEATDIGLTYQGQIRDGLPSGPIYQYHVNRVIPWDDSLVTLSVSGQDIVDMIERSLERSTIGTIDRPLLLHFSGIIYDVSKHGTLEQVWISNEHENSPIQRDHIYSMCCSEFLLSGLGQDFPLTRIAQQTDSTNGNNTLRQAVTAALQKGNSYADVFKASQKRINIHPDAPLLSNDESLVY